MNWTLTRHNEFLNFFEEKILDVLPDMNVFKTPRYFVSPQDFAAVVEDSYVKPYECRYVIFEYGKFVDSPSKGCSHDPNVWISFRGQLYRTTKESKTGITSSHDLLVSDLITLRNQFLNNQTIELHSVEQTGIVQEGDLIVASPSRYIVGDIGDAVNFRITLEINNDG